MKTFSKSIHNQVKSLLESGLSIRDVAAQLQVSKLFVGKLRRSLTSLQMTLYNGRPRLFTARLERKIARQAESGKSLTAVDVKNDLESTTLAIVSSNTVRRSLKRSGLHARIRKKKPLLRSQHRAARLAFAKKYEKWTMDDWNKVVWSDETKINLFGSDGRYYCWKKKGSSSQLHHFKPTVKHGGGSIFLWSCITAKGVGYMAKIDNGLDAKLYTEILKGELMDTLNYYGMEKDQIIFQHDNDRKHTANLTKQYISQAGLTILDWPSQSPDLNPIEHAWAELKKRLRLRKVLPTNMSELWEATSNEWYNISVDFCKKLIATMPKRITAVLKAKGGNTSW